MDGRHRALRPRTVQDAVGLVRPQGWIGQDPLRTQDPIITFETQLCFWPADITVPVATQQTILVPPRCAQVAFISLIPNVFVSINGGGGRTIKDGFIYNGRIDTLDVSTDATGTVIVQFGCY